MMRPLLNHGTLLLPNDDEDDDDCSSNISANVSCCTNTNYLLRWVILTYITLDIIVVDSHATSAYECELLAVTWHYLTSVRFDTVFSRENGVYTAYAVQLVNTGRCCFYAF